MKKGTPESRNGEKETPKKEKPKKELTPSQLDALAHEEREARQKRFNEAMDPKSELWAHNANIIKSMLHVATILADRGFEAGTFILKGTDEPLLPKPKGPPKQEDRK